MRPRSKQAGAICFWWEVYEIAIRNARHPRHAMPGRAIGVQRRRRATDRSCAIAGPLALLDGSAGVARRD